MIFSNFVIETKKQLHPSDRDNFFVKIGKNLDVSKRFSNDLPGEHGNMPRRGVVPKFSDLDIALALTAETESIDSESRLFSMLKSCRECMPNWISRRQYNDRHKFAAGLCEDIRKRLVAVFDVGEDYFCIDSKPFEVCRLSRGERCKMGWTIPDTIPNFAYCASQGVYYFGYKLHARTGQGGVVHYYDLSKASVHDLHYLNDIKPLFHDCSIFGDEGYISESVQLDLFETANIRLECPYRLNQESWKPTFMPFAKARKRVETVFSQLCDQYMVIRNYAKQTDGLFARIIGKISALTVAQYINYLNNQPIGRVKYALVYSVNGINYKQI